MSYKRQVQAHYHNFIHALRTISMPDWLSGRAMRAGLLGVVVFMSVAYMVRVNSAATRGYEAHALENKISEMHADLQSLQIKIADAGSMNTIEKNLPKMNLVVVEDYQRYNISGGVVAIAK
ncbi:MAG: hypothetical protein ACD_72C00001G0002 [uncultured bacterium]|nr:MAG: hypothetical protein ACD_72C00001G0002 [uncultured bacterium]